MDIRSRLRDFISEKCDSGEGFLVSRTELREAFNSWHGGPPVFYGFPAAVVQMTFTCGTKAYGPKRKQTAVYVGLSLKGSTADPVVAEANGPVMEEAPEAEAFDEPMIEEAPEAEAFDETMIADASALVIHILVNQTLYLGTRLGSTAQAATFLFQKRTYIHTYFSLDPESETLYYIYCYKNTHFYNSRSSVNPLIVHNCVFL
jgi:hypothetical protein